ncbi:MAG: helix-turn-helix transcriptional regulator [Clostridia bacterium]|nr:helix-turn-helix transcriptional regulator [Clostridia bacterium]
MYYNDTGAAYILQDVYHVCRSAHSFIDACGRTHSALAYRIKGGSIFQIDGRDFTAPTGSVVYIPAGKDYRIRYSDEELIVLHLNCIAGEGSKIEITPADEGTAMLFLELHRAWEAGGTARYPRCMSLLYRIFEAMDTAQSADSRKIPEVIAPGVSYMRKNFRDPELSIAALAERCHVSEVYFRRIYKAHFDSSPHNALLELRFDYAKSLLRSGYYQVKQVAAMSGFSDTKYFRTAFTKRYGVTPGEFVRHG